MTNNKAYYRIFTILIPSHRYLNLVNIIIITIIATSIGSVTNLNPLENLIYILQNSVRKFCALFISLSIFCRLLNNSSGTWIVFVRMIHLSYLQIHYYKHYNKSEFDAPEIHDADLKV